MNKCRIDITKENYEEYFDSIVIPELEFDGNFRSEIKRRNALINFLIAKITDAHLRLFPRLIINRRITFYDQIHVLF